jgi:DnaJ-class molecular chaperone
MRCFVIRLRRCPRCNGGGFVATKHGAMLCPFCGGKGEVTI